MLLKLLLLPLSSLNNLDSCGLKLSWVKCCCVFSYRNKFRDQLNQLKSWRWRRRRWWTTYCVFHWGKVGLVNVGIAKFILTAVSLRKFMLLTSVTLWHLCIIITVYCHRYGCKLWSFAKEKLVDIEIKEQCLFSLIYFDILLLKVLSNICIRH